MKTNKFLLMTMVLTAFLIGACSTIPAVIGQRVEGSGNVITEQRNVSGFDRVTLSGFGEVNISQGNTESLKVTTDDNIMTYIQTEVKGKTLVLGFTPSGSRRSIDPSDGIKFDLVVKDLNRLDISGAGSVKADSLNTEEFRIDLSGAGSLEIDSLQADELVASISGAGSVVVAGKVNGQDVSHSGVGTYYAGDLESTTAIFEISGAGSGTVWVLETLDVKISGVGNIVYYGTPRVIQEVSGLGKLIGQGDK